VRFSRNNIERKISIPIYGPAGVIVGEAVIPPGTFPLNCEIQVTQGSNNSDNSYKDRCGDRSSVEQASPAMNFTLNGCKLGGRTFKNPIKLSIVARLLNVSLFSQIVYWEMGVSFWEQLAGEFVSLI